MRWPRWAVDTHRVSRGSRCACFVLRGSRHGKRELPLSPAPGRGGPRGTTDCDVWGRVRLSRRVRGPSCRRVGGAGTLQTPSAWDGPPRVPRPGMREPKEAPPPPSLPGRLELEFDPLRAPSRIQSPTLCYRLHADSTHPGRLLTGPKGQHSSATGTPGCRSAGTSKGVLSSELHPNAPGSRLLLETVCHAGLCWHPPRTLQVRPVLSRPKAGLHPPPHCDPGARSCCGGPSSTPAPTRLVPGAVPSRDNHRCPQVPSAPCRQNHLAQKERPKKRKTYTKDRFSFLPNFYQKPASSQDWWPFTCQQHSGDELHVQGHPSPQT